MTADSRVTVSKFTVLHCCFQLNWIECFQFRNALFFSPNNNAQWQSGTRHGEGAIHLKHFERIIFLLFISVSVRLLLLLNFGFAIALLCLVIQELNDWSYIFI